MSDFSDSPDALGMMLDQLEAPTTEGTSSTPPTEQGTQGGEQLGQAAQVNQPAATAPGTTEPKPPEGQAKPNVPPTQSPLPKELESFKPLLEAKKWDPSKPNWVAEPLKALQEMEQYNGRLSTDLGLTRTRASEVDQVLLGTPEQINEHRERLGMPPLAFEKASYGDKLREAEAEFGLFTRMLSENEQESAAAIREFKQKIEAKIFDLKLNAGIEARAPKAGQNQHVETIKANRTSILSKYQDANEKLTSLVPYLKSRYGVGILGSFGMDLDNIMATPERAQAVYELAGKIHLAENFEAEVERRVKQAMEDQLTRQNAGAIQGGAPAQTPNQEADPVEELLAGFNHRR